NLHMAGDHTNHDNTGSGGMNLQATVAEIRRLQAKVAAIEQEKVDKAAGQDEEEETTEFYGTHEFQKAFKHPISPLSMEKLILWSI
ncbi:hypothetical protein A2U01_0081999, partial [Trifolium medium]|nr:hypothetical protein [Trifolium medium]